MPLVHSDSNDAFKKNIKKEIEHGKPQKQAVAIAYHEKRENMSKDGMSMDNMNKNGMHKDNMKKGDMLSHSQGNGVSQAGAMHGHHEGKHELKKLSAAMPKLGGNKHGHKK